MSAEDEHAVRDAVEVLGSSEAIGDMAAVLYGDDAASALGWAPAGIADRGGYRWAIDRAERRIGELGAATALRAIASLSALSP
jgi:hypothetical protein